MQLHNNSTAVICTTSVHTLPMVQCIISHTQQSWQHIKSVIIIVFVN